MHGGRLPDAEGAEVLATVRRGSSCGRREREEEHRETMEKRKQREKDGELKLLTLLVTESVS